MIELKVPCYRRNICGTFVFWCSLILKRVCFYSSVFSYVYIAYTVMCVENNRFIWRTAVRKISQVWKLRYKIQLHNNFRILKNQCWTWLKCVITVNKESFIISKNRLGMNLKHIIPYNKPVRLRASGRLPIPPNCARKQTPLVYIYVAAQVCKNQKCPIRRQQ